MYNTTTLPNGLRLIHRFADAPIVYCGYQVAAGSRDERRGEEGLAHFCEHMSFKGTTSRSAMQVLNGLEGVGGELNAFTSKDTTVYYAAIQKEHLSRAVRLLTDIVFRSVYPEKAIDKEREVVCDEIESFNDSPAELIYDDFENIIFERHPLGHSILGSQERVRAFTREDLLAFARRYYTPKNVVFFCFGDVSFPKLCRMLEREKVAAESDKRVVHKKGRAVNTPIANEIVRKNGTHQAHVMLGRCAYSIHDKRRLPLYLLNNILGGPSMNARLNLSLRERHALVYTVESSMMNYADTGLWTVYFGCDHKDVELCRALVRKELDRLMSAPLSSRQLAAAKRQIKGQLTLACDNRESFAIDFGKSFLHYGWKKEISSLCRDIDALTAEQLHDVAQELFAPESLTTLIYT